ncbi:MAG: trypsin-like peptidase domain-containing protein [Gammaproteobacteria bacterium]|nr:trypsin-like peptidase domain-containing protein [Gammaproteobacteria bacterium]
MANQSISLNKRVFMVFLVSDAMQGAPDPTVKPIGTAFGLHRPGIALTAAHIVDGQENLRLRLRLLSTGFKPPRHLHVVDVVAHEQADVAIIHFQPTNDLEWCTLGRPEEGYHDFPLGEEVAAYGFPMVGIEKPIPGRLMAGHIQCHLDWKKDHYRYRAYELSFPAFHNLSGAPVYRDWKRQHAIGVITDSISYGSTRGDEHTYAAWSLAASLVQLRLWIEEVVGSEEVWTP